MRFTSYKYWLNEKFTQDSDPIHDMGIGLDIERNFDNNRDACKWIAKHLPHILGTSKIPNDIIRDRTYYLKTKYKNIIEEYVKKYFYVMGKKRKDGLSWYGDLHEILRNRGYRVKTSKRYIRPKK